MVRPISVEPLADVAATAALGKMSTATARAPARSLARSLAGGRVVHIYLVLQPAGGRAGRRPRAVVVYICPAWTRGH